MEISGSNITMINGDSETIKVNAIDIDGSPAAFIQGDTVYLTVKKYTSDKESILQKIVTEFLDGEAAIEIAPADTINLSGGYVYDIQVNRVDGSVTTIIGPSQLIIERGVTT